MSLGVGHEKYMYSAEAGMLEVCLKFMSISLNELSEGNILRRISYRLLELVYRAIAYK